MYCRPGGPAGQIALSRVQIRQSRPFGATRGGDGTVAADAHNPCWHGSRSPLCSSGASVPSCVAEKSVTGAPPQGRYMEPGEALREARSRGWNNTNASAGGQKPDAAATETGTRPSICPPAGNGAAPGLCGRMRAHCRGASEDGPNHWTTVEQFGAELPEGTDSAGLWAQLRVPDSQARRRWDLIVYGLVIYTVFYFSFSSAFASSFRLDATLAVEYVVDFVFGLDIALSASSFFYLYSGDLCTDPALMRRNYLTGGMLIDVVGTTPVPAELALLLLGGEAARRSSQQVFRLVRLLRLLRISKLPRFERRHYTYLPGLRVAQLFLSFYAVVHVVACVSYLLFASRAASTEGTPPSEAPLDDPSTASGLESPSPTDDDSGWLNDDEAGSSTSERYVDALYVSLLIVVGEDR
jgi:hypothetical protein